MDEAVGRIAAEYGGLGLLSTQQPTGVRNNRPEPTSKDRTASSTPLDGPLSGAAEEQRRIDRFPILTFHDVSEQRDAITVSPFLLRHGVDVLSERGFDTVGLAEVTSWLREGKDFPYRKLAITFDDGYRSVYEHAFPALQRHDMSATVFLAVGSGDVSLGRRLSPVQGREMMSWGEIREMARFGIEFGAHTRSHPDLTCLSVEEIREEVRVSQAVIEDALGLPVPSFAYPFGRWNRQVLLVVRELFACACSDQLGLVTARSDPHLLERVDAYYLRHTRLFDLFPTRLLPWYVRACAVPRRLRRLRRLRRSLSARFRR